MATNKNSMLPTFQGRYSDMIGGIKHGDITSPCWFWVEDREDLCFIHWEIDPQGNKVLTPHVILWEKVDTIEKNVSLINETLGDMTEVLPEGQTVANFVTQTTEKQEDIDNRVINVTENVTNVQEAVVQIQQQGAAIMLTSEDIGGVE